MTDTTAIPRLGEALRELITRAGLRPAFDDLGLDKDLDDLAAEGRPGAHCRLLETLETRALKLVHAKCGTAWGDLIQTHWLQLTAHIRHIVQNIDVGLLPIEEGRTLFLNLFGTPLILDLLVRASRTIPGPPLTKFLQAPFAEWIEWSGVTLSDIEHITKVDERTFQRWRDGARIERLHPNKALLTKKEPKDAESAAGWLMVAIAAQSMDSEWRTKLASLLRASPKWNPLLAHEQLTKASWQVKQATPLTNANRVEEELLLVLSQKPLNSTTATSLLKQIEDLVSLLDGPLRTRSLARLTHNRARIAAISGRDEEALSQYKIAVSVLWWNSAEYQTHLLDEALIFAAGTADKVSAKHYWDMTYLLGTAPLPYRELDAVEMRRLSAAFESRFSPRRAVQERLTLGPEIIGEEFELNNEALAHPNRKKKFNDGDTRRTLFMDAILRGSLADVQEIMRVGGDINVYIEESGESALSFALRRAERRGKDILYELLELEDTGEPSAKVCSLSAETANRPFGVSRETPLKLAIDIADTAVIRRLVDCGADLEAPCANDVSALFHALNRFGRASIPGMQAESLKHFLAGKGSPDIHDARRGAISPDDMAATRQASMLPHFADPRILKEFEDFLRKMSGDPEKIVAAIETLLMCGGDPNRRKPDANGENWTPTLYAAAIGHLPLFQALLDYGGNPDLTLNEERSASDPRNALWAASRRKNHSIVQFLLSKSP